VRAVVASSTRRRFVMMTSVLGKNPEQQTRCLLTERVGAGDQQPTVRPDCGSLQMRSTFYFGGASS
jgi:hypothetical protein